MLLSLLVITASCRRQSQV